jgi:ADP-ribose pyrophosphatase
MTTTATPDIENYWNPSYTTNDAELLDNQICFSSKYTKLMKFAVRFKKFDGTNSNVVERYAIQKLHAAAILLFNPVEDYVVLVEQFRIGAMLADKNPWLLEPVAGLIDTELSPSETAIKEAREEAGCEVLELIPMCNYLSAPGNSNEETFMYCGIINTCDPEQFYGVLEENEDIKIHKIATKIAFELVNAGKIFNSQGIISLQWLQLNYAKLRQQFR